MFGDDIPKRSWITVEMTYKQHRQLIKQLAKIKFWEMIIHVETICTKTQQDKVDNEL